MSAAGIPCRRRPWIGCSHPTILSGLNRCPRLHLRQLGISFTRKKRDPIGDFLRLRLTSFHGEKLRCFHRVKCQTWREIHSLTIRRPTQVDAWVTSLTYDSSKRRGCLVTNDANSPPGCPLYCFLARCPQNPAQPTQERTNGSNRNPY